MKAMILERIWNLRKTRPLSNSWICRSLRRRKMNSCSKSPPAASVIPSSTKSKGEPPRPGFPSYWVIKSSDGWKKPEAGPADFKIGDRVGVAWIYSACGKCRFCREGNENLCPEFKATGRDANGGYAEYTVVPEDFAHPIPPLFTDGEAAPLLCAGAVGYRSLRLTGLKDGQNLGLVGFGASAHLVHADGEAQIPRFPNFRLCPERGGKNFCQGTRSFLGRRNR